MRDAAVAELEQMLHRQTRARFDVDADRRHACVRAAVEENDGV
jgi:hypothetical protein